MRPSILNGGNNDFNRKIKLHTGRDKHSGGKRETKTEGGKEAKVNVVQCQRLGKADNKAPRIFYIFVNLKYSCKSKIINITK